MQHFYNETPRGLGVKWDTLMCRMGTGIQLRLLAVSVLASSFALAQTVADLRPEWRKVGGTTVDLMLAAPATGPVDAVWFAADGRTLYARTHSGKTFETADFETWTASVSPATRPDSNESPAVDRLPISRAVLRSSSADPRHIYALADQIYASEDNGRNWTNLTAYKDRSVIGPGARDLAVSPLDANQLVVANERGVWRSLDGGLSWNGLNGSLPNLKARRILATPANGRGVQIEIDGIGAAELPPGNSSMQSAWQTVRNASGAQELELRRGLSAQFGVEITAFAVAGDTAYAGSSDGRIWASTDRGRSWNLPRSSGSGAIEHLWTDTQAPRVALAATRGPGIHVLRTTNTGGFWDDLTANLPDVAAHGVAADLARS